MPACGADLMAAGAGWRAWAASGTDQVLYRRTNGTEWFLGSIDATNVQHLVAIDSNHLVIAGDVLTFVDLTDLANPTTTTLDVYSGPEGDLLNVGSDLLVAAPAALEMAVVDVSDPSNPALTTGPTSLLDGAGSVVDIVAAPGDRVVLLDRGSNRLVVLDTVQLPSLSVRNEYSLVDHLDAQPAAADAASFAFPPYAGLLNGIFVLDDEGVVNLFDLDDLGAGSLHWFAPAPGRHDVVAFSDPSSTGRLLVASGRAGGVTELWYAVSDQTWHTEWLADLGDVRALAIADPAFRAGETAPETCEDIPHEATITSTVSCPGGAHLYALTELGPLPVQIDLCPQSQIHDTVITAAAFTLDTSTCTPVLNAAAGAVTAPFPPITVIATVSHPSLGELWTSDPITIASGEAFAIELASVEPGSEVSLTAVDASISSATELVATVPSSPPSVDLAHLGLSFRDGSRAELVVPLDAVENPIHPITIRFANLHPERASSISLGLGCHPGDYTVGSVPAQVGDPLELEICGGDLVQVCSGPIPLGETPFENLIRIQLDQPIIGLTRQQDRVLATTADGSARVLAIGGRWPPGIWGDWESSFEWPVGWPAISGLVATRDWNVIVAAGDLIAAIDINGPIFGLSTPIASGVPVEAWLHLGNHVVMAGRSEALDAILLSVLVIDSQNGVELCAPVAAAELPGSAGMRPLALLPLAPARVGLLVDTLIDVAGVPTPVFVLDISDPEQPVVVPDATVLPGLNVAPTSAVVEDDHLVITTGDGRLFMYRFNGPAGWQARLELGPADGAEPTHATRWGDKVYVGYTNGDIRRFTYVDTLQTDPPLDGVMHHPGRPVMGLTNLEYAALAAFPDVVEAYHADELDVPPALHREAVRFDGTTLSVRPWGVSSTDYGVDFAFNGEGVDGGGQPAPVTWTAPQLNTGDSYRRKLVIALPLSVGEVNDVEWTDVTMVDRKSGHADSVDLTSEVERGPVHFDRECRTGIHACHITTGAAGPGWRASASPDGVQPNRVVYRYTLGSGWIQQDYSVQGEVHHLATHGGLLLAAADTLTVSDMTDLAQPQHASADPFPTTGVGPMTGIPGTDYVVAASRGDLRLAVIDVSTPGTPIVVTPAQQLDDGVGDVVDLHVDEDGSLWVLATSPDRLVRLDATILPSLSVLEVDDLAGPAPAAAIDSGSFDSTTWGDDLPALFVVRSGWGLELYDADNVASGPLAQVPLDGSPRDVFAAASSSGLHVLVAAGLDRGVIEVAWNDTLGQWQSRWAADLGDVRAFAFADDAFRPGEESPETCADVGTAGASSVISDTGTPRLYAVTDAGLVNVDTNLREATFGGLMLRALPHQVVNAPPACPPEVLAEPYAHPDALDYHRPASSAGDCRPR